MLCIASLCVGVESDINMKYNPIWELILFKFELGHNAANATKNICCAKGEGAVDHITATLWFKNESEVKLQTIDANLVNYAWRVSGKLSTSQSSLVFQLHNLGKRGARGVMVIAVGNGHGNTSSNPGRD